MAETIHAAQSYLNFPGDTRSGLRIGGQMGPTTYGGVMYIVGWEYDEEADKTIVSMSAVNPTP